MKKPTKEELKAWKKSVKELQRLFKGTQAKYKGKHGDFILELSFNSEIIDSAGQCMNFRVGPIYRKRGPPSVGLWIDYQQRWMTTDLLGPFLMSKKTWETLSKNINLLFDRTKG